MRERPALILVLAAAILALGLPAFAETLTNESVMEMHKAGLPASVIVAKIETSETDFDTSVDALIALADASLPTDVITAMTKAGGEEQSQAAPAAGAATQVVHSGQIVTGQLATKQANVPTQFVGTPCPNAGVYLNEGEGEPRLIDPSAYVGAKTSGLWKSRLTYGIASSKSKAMLQGLRSHNKVGDRSPTFYFCFEESSTGLSYETSGATTPSQFLLVKLDVNEKQGARLLVTGKLNAFTGGYAGPPPNYRVDFTYEKLAPGVYEVYANGLTPGEYCFFYTGSASATGATTYGLVSPQGGGKVFDFSVG